MGCIRVVQKRAQGSMKGKYRKFPMHVVNQAIENLPDKYCDHPEDVNVSLLYKLSPVTSKFLKHNGFLVEV